MMQKRAGRPACSKSSTAHLRWLGRKAETMDIVLSSFCFSLRSEYRVPRASDNLPIADHRLLPLLTSTVLLGAQAPQEGAAVATHRRERPSAFQTPVALMTSYATRKDRLLQIARDQSSLYLGARKTALPKSVIPRRECVPDE